MAKSDLALKIAKYKGQNPELKLKDIAKKFNVSESYVFEACHKYPEHSKVLKKELTDKKLLQEIAIFKALNPKWTMKAIAEKFKVQDYVVRYALRKYSEYAIQAKLLSITKKGRQALSKSIAESIDHIEILKRQLNQCLAEIDNNEKMALSTRIDYLSKLMRIRIHIQQLELESHLKRADAQLIANIIRRYQPEATNDDVIKIYNEEITKIKLEKE